MASPDRGQSETIGVLLLTGVVVVTVGLIGIIILSGTASERERMTAVAVDVSTENVTLTHDGGQTLPESEITVIVDGQQRVRYGLTELNRIAADGNGRFDPGETWRIGHETAAGDAVQVILVHEPSGDVIRNERTQVPEGSGLIARFESEPDSPLIGETVTFDASGTVTGTESVDSYQWDFGDGSTASGETVTHSYNRTEEYDVTLTVTAGDKRSRTAETVQVAATKLNLSNVSLTDGDDDTVKSGDTLTVTGTMESGTRSVDNVTADASAFDAGTVSMTDGDDDRTYDATFAVGANPNEGDQSATVTATNTAGNSDSATTGTVRVDTTPPAVTAVTLTDSEEDVVNAGDTVTVTADVTDDRSGVEAVTANASAFDARTVTLNDQSEDGTYNATLTVGENPTQGEQSVTVTATDVAGNSRKESSDSVQVDTTAPGITLSVNDESYIPFPLVFIERFQIEWTVTDSTSLDVRVFVNRSGTVQDNYSGISGSREYTGGRLGLSGREHTIRVITVDAAGNRACRQVVDNADGSDPNESQYESC